MDSVEAIVAKLTRGQREALLRIDDRVYSRRELHYRTFAALFHKGLASDVRAAGHLFFTWTPLGLAVRKALGGGDEQG